jgi:multicomponent Na+:H+ antiporter subunit E
MRIIITAVLIYIYWLLLSGHTEPLLLSLGIVSTLLTVILATRMRVIDKESYPVEQLPRLFKYFVFLGKEIVLANIDVIKRILKPGRSISPHVVELIAKQPSDLGKVIYANSITLTPGTVTMDVKGNQLKVHALSREAADDLATGRMAKAIADNEENPA